MSGEWHIPRPSHCQAVREVPHPVSGGFWVEYCQRPPAHKGEHSAMAAVGVTTDRGVTYGAVRNFYRTRTASS